MLFEQLKLIVCSSVQWVQNEGKCGTCGDAYHLAEPRPHEAGGEFAKGTVVRHYQVGQVSYSLGLRIVLISIEPQIIKPTTAKLFCSLPSNYPLPLLNRLFNVFNRNYIFISFFKMYKSLQVLFALMIL